MKKLLNEKIQTRIYEETEKVSYMMLVCFPRTRRYECLRTLIFHPLRLRLLSFLISLLQIEELMQNGTLAGMVFFLRSCGANASLVRPMCSSHSNDSSVAGAEIDSLQIWKLLPLSQGVHKIDTRISLL